MSSKWLPAGIDQKRLAYDKGGIHLAMMAACKVVLAADLQVF
jgi:hypothetical protein